jgi:hypothetical protein
VLEVTLPLVHGDYTGRFGGYIVGYIAVDPNISFKKKYRYLRDYDGFDSRNKFPELPVLFLKKNAGFNCFSYMIT